MNKIVYIFLGIVLASIASFAILWAISPEQEKENVMASQGIRLIGSAVIYTAQNSTTPNRIRVGDLLIGSNEQVFRINELRKSQTGTIYVVVSWKYITNYTSYEQYISQPYSNFKTYELNSFAYNKNVISEPELKKFYETYSRDLIDNAMKNMEQQNSISGQVDNANKVKPTISEMHTTETFKAMNFEVQAYASTEISEVEDMDSTKITEMQSVLSEVQPNN